MADNDKIVGKVIAQPQVWVTDNDVNGHYYGFDEVGSVGGNCTHTASSSSEVFYYNELVDVTTEANLIDGDFTNGIAAANNDTVRIICIKNKGIDDDGDVTQQNIHITLNGGDPHIANDAIKILPNESFVMTPYNLEVDDLHICSSDDSNIMVEVIAIIYDISVGGSQ